MASSNVRLRNDLVVSEQQSGGRTAFVVKDATASRFFRLGEVEHFILQRLDGASSPESIQEAAEAAFGAPLPRETLDRFVERLRTLGLLDEDREGAERVAERRRRSRGSLLYLRLGSLDPHRLFAWLAPRLWFCFTSTFLVGSLVAIAGAAAIVLANPVEIGRSLVNLYHWRNLAVLYPVLFAVITVHEFAHGIACTWYGGKVNEIGFLLIYFQPGFYCNVSDAWLFPERAKRLWVSFAGAYLEIVVWALAVFVWRVVEPGTFVSGAAVVVMATSGIRSLFNLNPLIKLDGYYLLSDFLEIPNLRSRAFGYLRARLRRLLDGVESPERAAIPPRERRIYLLYGLLAAAYSTWLLGLVATYIGGALVARYQGWGFATFVGLLAMVFRRPLERTVRRVVPLPTATATSRPPRRRIVLLGAGLVAATVFAVVHADLNISGEFRILPVENGEARAGVEGVIEKVLVKEGDVVEAGTPIARLVDRDFRAERDTVVAKIEETQAKLRMLEAGPREEEIDVATAAAEKARDRLRYARAQRERLGTLFAEGVLSRDELDQAAEDMTIRQRELDEAEGKLHVLQAGTRPEEIDAERAVLARYQTRRRHLEQQLRLVDVPSPIAGVVVTPKLEEMVGRQVARGDLIANVHALDHVTAEIAVPERDISEVRVGQPIVLKARAFPGTSFEGAVASIAPTARKPVKGAFDHTVRVTTELVNPGRVLKPEMTGNAKIDCGPRRLLEIVTRRFARYVRVEFWSWW
jgi:putative peptide zinc metalloprotease protein